MNKFFINKPNGTRRNVISSLLVTLALGLGVMGSVSLNAAPVQAASAQTYTQNFQNPTTTLSGRAVKTSLYFSQVDYWQVKKATLSFNFQIPQLAARQTSDLTVAVNGVKVASFRPKAETGLQTKQIELPVKLLSTTNTLTISGQILNAVGERYAVDQTPANWLTIYAGTNVNYQYGLTEATPAIKSFYAHMTGMDTVVNRRSAVLVPQHATDTELSAGTVALAGLARRITTTDTTLPLMQLDDKAAKDRDYRLVIARADHLPADLADEVSASDLRQGAVIKTHYGAGKYNLIVTAKTDALLRKAAQFVANEELMSETKADKKIVTADTQTFTSVLRYQGVAPLTQQATLLQGPGHQEATYFVSLPVDRTNADGSTVTLKLRYARNLDFDRSLVTVRVAGQKVGSRRLSLKKADGDAMTFKLPRGLALANTFTVDVQFDLEQPGTGTSANDQTPWAEVETSSAARIKSAPRQELLFSNYPSTFVKQGALNNLLIVRPDKMTAADMATLTDIVTLLGNYAQQNTGRVTVTSKVPEEAALRESSVIAFGTPRANALINKLNSKLYFQYDKQRNHFRSNEKLSIETQYGHEIGTAQLLRSPYADNLGLLVVTGATPEATRLAATQISSQAGVSQYSGDAIVVDSDNQHMGYRFKKKAAAEDKMDAAQVISKNSQLAVYLGLAAFAFALVMLTMILIARKHGLIGKKKGADDNER